MPLSLPLLPLHDAGVISRTASLHSSVPTASWEKERNRKGLFGKPTYESQYWLCLARFWRQQEGCRGNLCEKRHGAAPCWTQPAPLSTLADTPQDTAESVREFELSLKTFLGMGRKHWTARGGGEVKKKSEKQ